MNAMADLPVWMDAQERDASLDEPSRLRERADVLDRLETWFGVSSDARGGATDLQQRAQALRARLEGVDQSLHARLRERLRTGDGRRSLLDLVGRDAPGDGDGYDHLDDLVAGVLRLDAPGEQAVPALDMVFYQPTPARHVFDLIRRVPLVADDVFVDLGSGLGHVALLVALCTDARAIGVELQHHCVLRARECAAALRLDRVEFIEQDARAADYSRGTLFYLYTPFGGGILRTVLDALAQESARRTFRICTYGACGMTVAAEPWLEAVGAIEPGRIAVFRSR